MNSLWTCEQVLSPENAKELMGLAGELGPDPYVKSRQKSITYLMRGKAK